MNAAIFPTMVGVMGIPPIMLPVLFVFMLLLAVGVASLIPTSSMLFPQMTSTRCISPLTLTTPIFYRICRGGLFSFLGVTLFRMVGGEVVICEKVWFT